MKLLYATSIDVPSTRANRIQVVSMARAFSALLPNQFLLGLRECRDGYDLKVSYRELGRGGTSAHLAWRYLILAKREQITHIYCREEKLLFFLILLNRAYFRIPLRFSYEMHQLKYLSAWWHRFLLARVSNVISITRAMRDEVVRSGYPASRITVAPDAVDIGFIDRGLTKENARAELGLLQDAFIALYTGTIDEPWKGVGTFYEAAKKLGDTYLCLIVGGKPHYVEEFNRLHPPIANVVLVGHKPHEEIPVYLAAADILVLPNSGQAEISRISTSPMKLFEYMAAGRPIVASDLPSIREILDETTSFLVEPDSVEALAAGTQEAIGNKEEAEKRAHAARTRVTSHTWEKRAQNIMAAIQTA